ncbi:ABC1 kinase family protein [Janibacter sp. GXQ6167]|uniref:ABC1 kinase family protein n=1 Tax=Janibacter sp. GXQ6167 TaxID=3240791 RepID=UPI00352328FD
MDHVTEIPRRALTRTARLASLPLGAAGRAAVGLGKRATGQSSAEVAEEMQRRTAEQLFTVLGSLKGGAMKVGQAMSVLEAALPEDLVEPYREMLAKLQDAAPPMSSADVHTVLTRELGPRWREQLVEFGETPVAAASIGQVHRGTWADGRTVAVKLQYPGAEAALRSDLQQLARLARVIGAWMPGLDVKPVTEELLARADEELDYILEAEHQRAFAAAYADDPDVVVPQVVAGTRHVLITEWLDGVPLGQIIRDADQPTRDAVASLYLSFLVGAPARAGMVHADPHPGNYRVTPDGRLGVIDFGAVGHLPYGLPPVIGELIRLALAGRDEEVLAGLLDQGFIRRGTATDAHAIVSYLRPFIEPLGHEEHRFSREWLREVSQRTTDFRHPEFAVGMKFNLPPEYLMIHRVFLGGIGVLSQIGGTVPARALGEQHLPGFAEPR